MTEGRGIWLSIHEYSRYKKQSISTVRRRIKSNHLKFKLEEGKYYIWISQNLDLKKIEDSDSLDLKIENQALKRLYREIMEENAALKMLIKIYEEQLSIKQENNNDVQINN